MLSNGDEYCFMGCEAMQSGTKYTDFAGSIRPTLAVQNVTCSFTIDAVRPKW